VTDERIGELAKRMISIVCGLVMVPLLAAADPKHSKWYKHGEDQYNLGN
jgi:hypothetical protein